MAFLDKLPKLKKSLAVCKDLNALEFEFNAHGSENKLYALIHPQGKYTVWVANGFWFCALYQVGGRYVADEPLSRFGAIGKCLVWWKCKKHIKRHKKSLKEKNQRQEQDFFDLVNQAK